MGYDTMLMGETDRYLDATDDDADEDTDPDYEGDEVTDESAREA